MRLKAHCQAQFHSRSRLFDVKVISDEGKNFQGQSRKAIKIEQTH